MLGYSRLMRLAMFHPMFMVVIGGVLRSGGHKTWVAWAITGVVVVVAILARLSRRR